MDSNFEFIPSHLRNLRKLSFFKLQGLGNDFIIVYFEQLKNISENNYSTSTWWQTGFAKSICDRNFGVGADGLVILRYLNSQEIKDLKLSSVNYKKVLEFILFNADGTRAEISGNGLRCSAFLLSLNSNYKEKEFYFLIGKELRKANLISYQDISGNVRVQMGRANFYDNNQFKFNLPALNKPFELNSYIKIKISAVSVGNPHLVTILGNDKDIDSIDLNNWADIIKSKKEIFPQGVNFHLVKPIKEFTYKIRSYERGVGETFACGSGATAVSSVLWKLNFVPLDKTINIITKSGESLFVSLEENSIDGQILLEGSAKLVSAGYWFY